jgi:prolipoprotein diacylglyceryltransferase
MPPLLPYFKVNICPLRLPHFASVFFAYFVILSLTQLYRYTPEIFLFSTATFKYKYRAPSDELDKNIQRKSHFLFFSHWNGYSHFRFVLNWFKNYKKKCFKYQMSVIWSWTYSYNLHWNNYLYFKGLLVFNFPGKLLSYTTWCITEPVSVVQHIL